MKVHSQYLKEHLDLAHLHSRYLYDSQKSRKILKEPSKILTYLVDNWIVVTTNKESAGNSRTLLTFALFLITKGIYTGGWSLKVYFLAFNGCIETPGHIVL